MAAHVPSKDVASATGHAPVVPVPPASASRTPSPDTTPGIAAAEVAHPKASPGGSANRSVKKSRGTTMGHAPNTPQSHTPPSTCASNPSPACPHPTTRELFREFLEQPRVKVNTPKLPSKTWEEHMDELDQLEQASYRCAMATTGDMTAVMRNLWKRKRESSPGSAKSARSSPRISIPPSTQRAILSLQRRLKRRRSSG